MKIIILLLLFLIVGCGEEEIIIDNRNNPPLGIVQVDYEELTRSLDYDHIAIIDVRTPDEYQRGHIEGAISIPIDQLSERVNDLLQYDEIIVYCRTNNRATQAYNILQNHFDAIYVFYEGYEKCCN